MNNTPSPGRDDGELLPEVVRQYQDAHDRHETDIALSAFTPDARVIDESREYRGSARIRHWLETAASEYTYTRTCISAEALTPDTWRIVNHLDGDFPGRAIDLSYQFRLTGGLISELLIAP